jgi:hypothetical protein
VAKTKDAGASLPLPVTGSVPLAGDIFFGANRGKSYRLASGPDPVIPTIPTGPRGKVALLHVLARKLGIDPNNPRWAHPGIIKKPTVIRGRKYGDADEEPRHD